MTKMTQNTKFPQRKNTRLPEYDYSLNGAYFITVCTHNRRKILSDVVGEGLCALPKIRLSGLGQIIHNCIEYINTYHFVRVDSYVIMPDHIHLLISINAPEGHRGPSLQHIMQQFKSYTTHKAKRKFWQRSFYDHIVRNEDDLKDINDYIVANPIMWLNGKHDDSNYLR